ncbi:hypothetical protein SK128_023261 [Halocaridina rubra]|uniref:MADF domain-containing protein n=1 Tax=Halocaridina rubra TaxID=373956 RepID=A0AAN8ZYI5_HALRR
MVGRWSESDTLKFIYFYRLHDCLWNSKSEYYTNKTARQRAYMEIVEQMNIDSFDVRGVKVKIKNLRAHYFTERKKARIAIAIGNYYEPTVYWFREMDSFLKHTLTDMHQQQPEVITADSIYDSSCIYENGNGDMDEDSLDKPLPVFHLPDGALRPKPKSKKTASKKPSGTAPQKKKQSTNQPEQDEFEVFGRSVAAQLRKLSLSRAMTAQTRIQVILTEERLQDLESNSPPPTPIETSSAASENNAGENLYLPEHVPRGSLEPDISMTTSVGSFHDSLDNSTNQSIPSIDETFEETKPVFENASLLSSNMNSTDQDIKPVFKDISLSFDNPHIRKEPEPEPEPEPEVELPYERPKPACKKKKRLVEQMDKVDEERPKLTVREIHIKPEFDVITLDEDDPLADTS